jgi:phosphoglycerol transferase MdoB-like AlkP superfamily enzyme
LVASLARCRARLTTPLARRTSWLVAAGLALGIAASFWRHEGVLANVVFTAATTLTLGALIVLATRRVLFAAVMITAFIALINGIADAKLKTLGMVLHAYDIVFYLGSWSTVTYLWFAVPHYVIGFGLAMTAAGLLAALAWRLDATRASRRATAMVAALALATTAGAGLTKPDRRHTQFYWEALYVSSFYGSWAETVETLWRGQLIEAAHTANAPAFSLDERCGAPGARRPHIVLIHQESVVQPGLFSRLDYDRSIDRLFRSHDGRIHKLRVETYGGASWLTEFSILTGLSTHAFGGMRPFVQSLLAGKVRDTLPETLARCGYRNVLFYPMLRNFVSNARFYDSVGLKEIFDRKAQGAKSEQERDRVYYANALDEMEHHVRSSPQPLFTYIQTMSVHWPYNWVFEPGVKVPGGGPGTEPEMSEYLRRLAMAKLDYDYLIAELRRRFPGEPVLVMHYGDHHPLVTQKLLGYEAGMDVEDMVIDPQSLAFITYFAVEGINHTPKPLPDIEVVDVPYLGAILLEQAGLPLSEPNRERLRLMRVCEGHYHGCTRKTEVLAFHRRLIDARLIQSR